MVSYRGRTFGKKSDNPLMRWSWPPRSPTRRDGCCFSSARPAGRWRACGNSPAARSRRASGPEAALVRELREELGIEVDAGRARARRLRERRQCTAGTCSCCSICAASGRAMPRALHAAALVWLRPDEMASLPMPPADVPLVDAANRPRSSDLRAASAPRVERDGARCRAAPASAGRARAPSRADGGSRTAPAVLPSASAAPSNSAIAAARPKRPIGRASASASMLVAPIARRSRTRASKSGKRTSTPSAVDDRQGEAGAGEQVAGRADVDLRMDLRRRAAFGRVGGEHRRACSRGRLPAPAKAPRNRPSGRSARRISSKRAGQIVDRCRARRPRRPGRRRRRRRAGGPRRTARPRRPRRRRSRDRPATTSMPRSRSRPVDSRRRSRDRARARNRGVTRSSRSISSSAARRWR